MRDLKAGSGGEIQLADAINVHALQGSVETVRLNGQRFDCGSVDGFLDAIMHQAKQGADLIGARVEEISQLIQTEQYAQKVP